MNNAYFHMTKPTRMTMAIHMTKAIHMAKASSHDKANSHDKTLLHGQGLPYGKVHHHEGANSASRKNGNGTGHHSRVRTVPG